MTLEAENSIKIIVQGQIFFAEWASIVIFSLICAVVSSYTDYRMQKKKVHETKERKSFYTDTDIVFS